MLLLVQSYTLDKAPLSGAVTKLASINLRELVLSPTGSINLGFTTEVRLAAVLIIIFSWVFQLGGHYKTPTSTPHHQRPIRIV
jgi:hypothetical protein